MTSWQVRKGVTEMHLCPLASSGGAWDSCRGEKCALWDGDRKRCSLVTSRVELMRLSDAVSDLVELGKRGLQLQGWKGPKRG